MSERFEDHEASWIREMLSEVRPERLVGCFAGVKELDKALLSRDMRTACDRIVKSIMVGLTRNEYDIKSIGGLGFFRLMKYEEVYKREGFTGRY